ERTLGARADYRPLAPPPPQASARVRTSLDDAAVHAFRVAMLVTGGLVVVGGVLSAVGIENPRRSVPCPDCPGGAAVGPGRLAAALGGRSVALVRFPAADGETPFALAARQGEGLVVVIGDEQYEMDPAWPLLSSDS